MHSYLILTISIALVSLSACGQSHVAPGPTGTTTDSDGGWALDAGVSSRDAAMTTFDSGPAVVEVDNALANALSCRLSQSDALAGAVRMGACDPDFRDHGTASYVVETWEVGLASRIEANTGGPLVTCERLRCAARSDSCTAYAECVSGLVASVRCGAYSSSCDGSWMSNCNSEGDGMEHVLDCAALGASCVEGRCQRGDCSFGADYYQLDCIGDELVLCDDLRVRCDAWQPGTSCRSVAVGGEAPSDWCAPAEALSYGVYGLPITCTRGSIAFDSFSGRSYRYDCAGNGYAGCDERGCVP